MAPHDGKAVLAGSLFWAPANEFPPGTCRAFPPHNSRISARTGESHEPWSIFQLIGQIDTKIDLPNSIYFEDQQREIEFRNDFTEAKLAYRA